METISATAIAEPMLLEGTHTRSEIVAEIRRLRPDFKDPSAAISSQFRKLVLAGKHPGLVESDRPRGRAACGKATEASAQKRRKRRLARLEQWAAETTERVEAGFAKFARYRAALAAQPKHARIWA